MKLDVDVVIITATQTEYIELKSQFRKKELNSELKIALLPPSKSRTFSKDLYQPIPFLSASFKSFTEIKYVIPIKIARCYYIPEALDDHEIASNTLSISISEFIDKFRNNFYAKIINRLSSNLDENLIHIPKKSDELQNNKILLYQIIEYIVNLVNISFVFNQRYIENTSFLYIADQIHNRLSLNPSTQKKEPPVGGVKIGGELEYILRHVTEILYLNPFLYQNEQRNSSPISLAGT